VKFNQIPHAQGLYDPRFEHDSCGVGFICDIRGRPTADTVAQGLEMLRRMAHRGATGADPDSGDGAGILLQLPKAFLRQAASEAGIAIPDNSPFAAGLAFLDSERGAASRAKAALEEACRDEGLSFLGWRKVPSRPGIIGETARKAMPSIEMAFAGAEKAADARRFEIALFRARRRAEKRVAAETGRGAFYMPSFSSRVIVYKGMLTPGQLGEFFPDLSHPLMASAIALVHSRYSTNTFPSWDLAQPFRFLAHNGEINTLRGNAMRMAAREPFLSSSALGPMDALLPVIQEGGSDSSALDNALELLALSGRSLAHAMSMLVPAAWEGDESMESGLRSYYRYHRCLMEAWDGPAALAFTDGSSVAAALDRNGLRPARYLVTKDGRVLMASEMGVLDVPPAEIERSGRLEPGKILYVDTVAGRIVGDDEIKARLASMAPYGAWLEENLSVLRQERAAGKPSHDDRLLRAMGYDREELSMVLAPMAKTGTDPVGSMGDDAPHAVLSKKRQPLFHYFRQLFAQVTNPPIDSIREQCVMSLSSVIGPAGNALEESPALAARTEIEAPVWTEETLASFTAKRGTDAARISLLFRAEGGEEAFTGAFASALERVRSEAIAAVRDGRGYLVLSDRGVDAAHAAPPSLLALAAAHRGLLAASLRSRCAIIVESAEPRETHHFCVLSGYGADAIVPYGAYQALAKLIAEGELRDDFGAISKHYLHAVEHGILKVISKMGISTLQSYAGAQIFEAVGLGRGLVDAYFAGTPSRLGGIGIERLARERRAAHEEAFGDAVATPRILPTGGFYKWRRDGEAHAWNPDTISLLQRSVRSGDYEDFKRYAAIMDSPPSGPIVFRHLLRFKKGNPVPLEEVEPESEIVKRFATGAMSYGSISGPAHETIAAAMNRIGGMSNTGEGGEDVRRFVPLPNGDSLSSYTKQVASGRFGVTAYYLANARDIQIKIAQGAKPGEGGQLPGHKVSETIARTRYTTPGVTLISPPPHHDLYSIEDRAQLIRDLKNVNPEARVSVKLVSEVGVGTVAAGVAKGRAEMILISGGDGGTGASPLGSIKRAGLPWELGLAETHQTLVMNGLRSRVRLQCDGGIRTGRDAVIACLLGAEEFGYAASALIAEGCLMLRHCHLNNCSVGVATQDDRCAGRFGGKPEHVANLMLHIARHMRETMAELGFRSIDEMVGRSDMLEASPAAAEAGLDFSLVLHKPASAGLVRRDPSLVHPDLRAPRARRIIELARGAIDRDEPTRLDLPIANTDRSAGARLSGEIMKRRGEAGLAQGTLRVELSGVAGQSFGAWLCKGATFSLRGMANDYVGKGLFGGTIVVSPGEGADFRPEDNVIIGNVALYGAISGELFARGRAGERFCVRNSGAVAVAEGVGDHGCEYMTGGTAVILGPVGRNFAAGMSGGIAYVWDPEGSFASKFKGEFADVERPSDSDAAELKRIIGRHHELTGSDRAAAILAAWEENLARFRKVMPRDYRAYLASKGGSEHGR